MDNKRFVRATQPAQRRLVMALDGNEKMGKTHFALTAPGPIAVLSLDNGLDGVIQRFQDQKPIYVVQYERRNSGPMASDDPPWKIEDWEAFTKDFSQALTSAKTVVVDSCTEAWEMLRVARFGRTLMVPPVAYPPVNAEFRRVLNMAYGSTANVILLHRLREVYDTQVIASKDGPKEVSVRTGKFERSGFKEMGYAVQVNARVERRPDGFCLTVADCRQNSGLAGVTFPQPVATFPDLALAVFPDSSRTDWE